MAVSLSRRYTRRSCCVCGALHAFRPRYSSSSVSSPAHDTDDLANAGEHVQPKWKSVVGLEIHAQINSASKLFSAAGTQYGASRNTQVSFFDAALPGTLPVLNKKCVEAGILTALTLGCDINLVSKFDRKHYFYADLPAGYQITQQRKPLAVNGHVTYVYQPSGVGHAERRSARLVQIQLEQDSGKSLHDSEEKVSLIDLNRAGVGLMEIVTAPDFTDGEDASSFVRDLRDILLSIGTCDGKMAEGSLRVDANISVHRAGEPLGTRTEVKNLNSLRSMRVAIDYEIIRQIKVLEDGGVIQNETRSFDVEHGETVPMRDKEKVLDYRFMPEPNLPPLVIHKSRSSLPPSLSLSHAVVLEDVEAMMTEPLDVKRQRLENDYGISLTTAIAIVRADLVDLLETLVKDYNCEPNTTSSLLRKYSSFLADAGLHQSQSPISQKKLAEVIEIYGNKSITGTSLTTLFQELATSQRSCREIMDAHHLWAISDVAVITAVIEEVLSRNPKMIKAYKKGKTNQLDVFQTKVLHKLDGKADPILVLQMITEKLK
ncbi:hypothetical protein BsWGS_15945 [Bradybaena similaris]